MRFAIQIIKVNSVNSYKKANFLEINQGETADLYFQLIDKDQDGLRYLPASGATCYVEIPRFPEYMPTISNVRQEVDYSIRRNAVQPFAGDGSIWMMPLTAGDTENIMSSDIRVTLTEGSKVSKTLFIQALKVVPKEGAPQ
jgi:hypothetical protein